MSNIQIFENPEFGSIRTVEINNEPWFVGKDVAEALGYKNTKDAIGNHVDDFDKRIFQRSENATLENHLPKDVFPVNFVDATIPNRGLTVINESGVYSLVFGSKLPKAKEFKRWVTSEVLPAIRKHGGYLSPEKIEEVLSDPDTIIKLATNLKEEQAKRREAEAALNEAKPKMIFADAVSASEQTILIGDLAKLIKQNGHDIGQKRLFQWMRDNGYLIKRNGADYNSPTQRAMEMGLFRIKESTVVKPDGSTSINKTTKVTGKGQQYFINKFLGNQTEQELW